MPAARGFAGATIAAGKIFVVGGQSASGLLNINASYRVEVENSTVSPWQTHHPLPEAQLGTGVTSIADVIYVFGGKSDHHGFLALTYLTANDQWERIEPPSTDASNWLSPRAITFQSRIYLLGGTNSQTPTASTLSYQAIYTIVLPAIQK